MLLWLSGERPRTKGDWRLIASQWRYEAGALQRASIGNAATADDFALRLVM